jgi:hypothetical protein
VSSTEREREREKEREKEERERKREREGERGKTDLNLVTYIGESEMGNKILSCG